MLLGGRGEQSVDERQGVGDVVVRPASGDRRRNRKDSVLERGLENPEFLRQPVGLRGIPATEPGDALLELSDDEHRKKQRLLRRLSKPSLHGRVRPGAFLHFRDDIGI